MKSAPFQKDSETAGFEDDVTRQIRKLDFYLRSTVRIVKFRSFRKKKTCHWKRADCHEGRCLHDNDDLTMCSNYKKTNIKHVAALREWAGFENGQECVAALW